jgi:hypothetical protein
MPMPTHIVNTFDGIAIVIDDRLAYRAVCYQVVMVRRFPPHTVLALPR